MQSPDTSARWWTASSHWWDGKMPHNVGSPVHQGQANFSEPHHFVSIFLCLDYSTRTQYFRLLSQPPEHQKKYDCPGSGKQDLANKISSSLWVRHSNQEWQSLLQQVWGKRSLTRTESFRPSHVKIQKGSVLCRTIALVWMHTEAWEGEEQTGGGKLFAICSS